MASCSRARAGPFRTSPRRWPAAGSAGGWWGHARGKEIFWLTRAVRDSPDVLVCRLVTGKVTYVHRRLWPALVRLARAFAQSDLAALREVHTASGAHALRV